MPTKTKDIGLVVVPKDKAKIHNLIKKLEEDNENTALQMELNKVILDYLRKNKL